MCFALTQAAILAKDYLKHYHFLGRMLGKVWLASFISLIYYVHVESLSVVFVSAFACSITG